MQYYGVSKYRLYNCYHCLCEVCTRRHCQYSRMSYLHDFCIVMRGREVCPVRKCDFFEHKEKFRVWKVKRKGVKSRTNIVMEKLNEISKKIDSMR